MDRYRALIRGEDRRWRAHVARAGLRALSLPYGAAVRVRNRLYDWGWKRTERAGVPVVCVGNLTAGGTGKTPCVEYLARFYRESGLIVAVLSRGYGADQGRNDEALLLEENLPDVPHLQGADRVELARTAVEELESELLILDDGFQHRRLDRDLDVVLIDATDPWGHGLLPRGLLREPRSGLRRAGAVVLTRADQAGDDVRQSVWKTVGRFAPGAARAEAVHRPIGLVNGEGGTESLEHLRGKPVGGFCGIGNPEAFRHTLRSLGADVADFRTFPDHHNYARTDVETLRRWADGLPAGAAAVTTQKDMVKLRLARLGGRELWAVRVGLHVTAGEDALHQRLRSVVP
jgi:tetraacyldisaccharide 4'-kinase